MMNKHKILIGCLCAAGSEILYGLSYAFTKTGVQAAGAAELLGWRFLIACAVMVPAVLCGLVKINFKKDCRPLLPVVILCPVVYFMSETLGIRMTTASETGVMMASIPIVSLVLSSVMLHKKPTRLQVTGILITFTGVVITVVAAGISTGLNITGYLFLILGVLSYSLYSVYVEKAKGFTDMEITCAMLAAGAVTYVSFAVIRAAANGSLAELVTLPFTNTAFLTAVLYQGIGSSVLAFLLANGAITRLGVNGMSCFIGVSTVVSLFSGAFALHESISALQLFGAFVIIAGIYTANVRLKKR